MCLHSPYTVYIHSKIPHISEHIPYSEVFAIEHFILECFYYQDIRENFLPKFVDINPHVGDVLGKEKLIMMMILDPLNSKLPEELTKNWLSVKEAYNLSRSFIYNMHRKREKFYDSKDKKHS